jgi:hypothetical protein
MRRKAVPTAIITGIATQPICAARLRGSSRKKSQVILVTIRE